MVPDIDAQNKRELGPHQSCVVRMQSEIVATMWRPS